MSLKTFHLIFILASTLLAFGFGAWSLFEHGRTGSGGMLAMGVVGLAVGAGLIAYESWFVRMLRGMDSR